MGTRRITALLAWALGGTSEERQHQRARLNDAAKSMADAKSEGDAAREEVSKSCAKAACATAQAAQVSRQHGVVLKKG